MKYFWWSDYFTNNLTLIGKRLNLEMWIEEDEIDYQRTESIISGMYNTSHPSFNYCIFLVVCCPLPPI